MPYPIITPEFFNEFADNSKPENNDIVYNVISSPSAIEYVFPLNQERIIRKLMDTPDILKYKMATLKPEQEAEYAKRGEEIVKEHPFLKNYWALKTLTMNILQNRNYIFEKRMLLMNFAYKTVQGIMEKSEEDLIPKFVNDFTNRPEHDDVIKYFESIRPNFAYSLGDGLSFLRSMPDTEDWDKVLYGIFKNVGTDKSMKNYKYDDKKYLPMKKAYYEDFLKGKEHYIEHIMVNYVWTHCMPYADFHLTLWENFIFYNTIFNAVKVMLTCYTYDKKDKDEAFVFAVKAFDDSLRRVKGNIVRHIVEVNKESGMTNNGDMAILSMS